MPTTCKAFTGEVHTHFSLTNNRSQTIYRMKDLDVAGIENVLESRLGCTIKCVVVGSSFSMPSLSREEQAVLDQYKHQARRESWLRARAALKALLAELGQDPDTAKIAFPNSRVSISHTGEFAVAVARTDDDATGIGVDLETNRTLKEGVEKFFLSDAERAWLKSCPEQEYDSEKIRLWTVKESVYKSDCLTQDGVFKNYLIENPAELNGAIKHKAGQKSFRYTCCRLSNFWLTVSVAEGLITHPFSLE